MNGGAHPSPFAVLSFPDYKKVPVYCWVDSFFQSSDCEAQPRNHKSRRKVCTITMWLLPPDYGAALPIHPFKHFEYRKFSFPTRPMQ